jgi:NADP-dependent 3-hydroxy acid dehydrogenase YdfG
MMPRADLIKEHSVDERVLFITGASSGIGEATAHLAAAEGFRLILAARREDKLNALAEALSATTEVIAAVCDVTSWEDQQQVVARGLQHFGRIDAVFANAGIGGHPGGFRGGDPERWRNLILTNFFGVALTLRASLEALQESKGHVLVNGSVAGRKTLAGSMYGATKWAVSGMMYNLREELRGTGVRVTLIEPGGVDTPFFDSPKPDALKADDVARSVLYSLQQPPGVEVHELMILPTPPLK